ncbi:MAG TPA: hypothetical protein VGR28_02660 [Candidatus Thermoplasmatota archaeon]|jgi:hypothetical protein|nr:hypothetical protein [Candidatus Thermoplasmatota archaeon]
MLGRLALLGALALVTIAPGSAEAWHVTLEFCLSGCSVPTVVTTPEMPWPAPLHPPSPCAGAAGVQACATFP